mmetsp:Transcript_29902/g.27372  ORF Transcript_29902/g.27372 Transcript_29902/m.27372 type:complete len:137 (+) Transcript_29902:591-1001(+)
MVRRAVAINIKDMVECVEEEFIKIEILPIFANLIRDEIDSVKISSIENCSHMLKYYTKNEIQTNIIPYLKNADPQHASWRIRFAVGEALLEISKQVDDEIVRKNIFPVYDQMLKDHEQEVKSNAVLKVVELLDKLT